MYRLFLTVLLCLKMASPAPQAKESEVTYVKIQPIVEDTSVEAAASSRESRIEKLPLTIPGDVSISDKEPDKILTETSEGNQPEGLSEEKSVQLDYKTNLSSRSNLSESTSTSNLSENYSDSSEKEQENKSDSLENQSQNKSVSSENEPENLALSETIQSDTISDGTEESITTDDLSEVNPTDDLSVSHSGKFSDTVPSETSQSDRRARNFGETTETAEDATEKYEDELIPHSVIETPITRAPPKFVPKTPKLSYYPKPRVFQSYSANHLDVVGKRKFRSRCSCQKIWNCPKLQISVPRCPDEYFLCCF